MPNEKFGYIIFVPPKEQSYAVGRKYEQTNQMHGWLHRHGYSGQLCWLDAVDIPGCQVLWADPIEAAKSLIEALEKSAPTVPVQKIGPADRN